MCGVIGARKRRGELLAPLSSVISLVSWLATYTSLLATFLATLAYYTSTSPSSTEAASSTDAASSAEAASSMLEVAGTLNLPMLQDWGRRPGREVQLFFFFETQVWIIVF